MSVVSIIDGVEIMVEGIGDQAIMMLHGWPDTADLWDAQVETLKENYRCIRFTLPGFSTLHKHQSYSIKNLNQFLLKVLDETCPDEKVILMIHDWGCLFGYQFYNQFPERISKIIGVDIGDTHSWIADVPKTHQMAAYAYQASLAACWKLGGKFGDMGTRSVAKVFNYPGDMSKVSSSMNYPYVMFRYAGTDSYLKNITPFEPECPFLFLYGANNPLQSFSRKWAERIKSKPGNRVVPLDTEHWVMLEKPKEFNQIVLDWLSQTD